MSEQKFFSYPDIENSYQQGFIDKIKEAGYGEIPYLITEKIHGANSQIEYDVTTEEFLYGNRSKFLAEDEKFYNLQKCLKKYEDSVKKLSRILKKDLAVMGQQLKTVIVYGEIFGGTYPHEDVQKDRNGIKVQKGVFYSPSNDWLAFDVAYTVFGSDNRYFLSGNRFFSLCVVSGIDVVPVLCEAKNLDEALAYKDDMPSFVYHKYKLPKIEDNIMEGIVIRPLNDDVWFGNHRLILKKKNDKFKEKSRAKKEIESEDIPENVIKAREEISQFITINRVHNVISHIGEVTPKDIGRVIMETGKDVLADYNKEYQTLNNMEKKEEKLVTKYMNDEIAKVVRDVILFGK